MKQPPSKNPRFRYLRTAPPTARLTVPLETRAGVQTAGTILRRLGVRLEAMGASTSPDEVAGMLASAYGAIRQAELELKLRLRIDRSGPPEAPGID